MIKKIAFLAMLVIAVPACKKNNSCSTCKAHDVEERVSGPAGWEFEEEYTEELK